MEKYSTLESHGVLEIALSCINLKNVMPKEISGINKSFMWNMKDRYSNNSRKKIVLNQDWVVVDWGLNASWLHAIVD